MDGGDPIPSSSPLPAAGLALRQPQQRQLANPRSNPLSPRGGGAGSGAGTALVGSGGQGGRDAKFRRASPKLVAGRDVGGPGGARWMTKVRVAPLSTATTSNRPLVPVTERRPTDDSGAARLRGRRPGDSDGAEKCDITPDGGSAGREGRQFTVANVGNNGRIYLRPTLRPAHQRYPQPNFVFPMSPPGTAGLEPQTLGLPLAEEDGSELLGSQWTPTPSTPRQRYLSGNRGPVTAPRHRRAHSDSTVQEAAARETDSGAFKVVISKPGDELRPKTMEDLDPTRAPLLDITIPTWRLGTPHFTVRGTAFIRGSSYAPTEDFPRSSNVSFLNRSHQNLASSLPDPVPSRAGPPPIPHIRFPSNDRQSPVPAASPQPPPTRLTYMSTHMVIEPEMFDALTFKPASDDRSIVRYSPATGAVTAATPSRLVAEITSPTFLDYELISDFFLTYRAFLESSDLLRMLIARLRWAVARDDEIGMVVRVRTFVALRHWILNYFMDDFVIDYGLRVTFCNLLNDFVDELVHERRSRKVQLKILAELKKCWRRVCAQYWDGPEFDASLGAEVPISPGGIAGHRNPSLDPTFWERDDIGPQRLDSPLANGQHHEQSGFYPEAPRAGHVEEPALVRRPGTPPQREDKARRHQMSPTSIVSIDIVSCSFPGKNMRIVQPGTYALAAHPVEASSVYSHAGPVATGPVATTPKALVGKRVRPQHSHKRNGSLTDSLREHATTAEKAMMKDHEFLLTIPFAGSLVRGNLMPPGQPFVEVVEPSVAGESQRQTTVFEPQAVDGKEKGGASAMSGQGMKKLLGSVRRALSTKGQGVSPTQGNFINISPIGPRGATTNRLPGTAIVPQARPRLNGIRPPVRIDLLGAEIAEDFKKAVREEAAAEAERRGLMVPMPLARRPVPGELLEYSAAYMDSTTPDTSLLRPTSDMGITTGSKSIVIVDDTVPFDLPAMTGALPVVNPSVEAFADSFLPNGADPTPPNTPPGHAMGTPRRSSYLLNQHIIRPSLSSDPLPPFIPDMDSLADYARPSQDTTRPSVDFVAQSPNRPPLSGGSFRMHRRHRSSRTNQSLSSMMHHRRYASYHSGMAPQPTIRSFDATTYSDGMSAAEEEEAENAMPEPLRVLRRRPGGDLRAATNVGDLDVAPLRRSRSVGSLTTYTDSVHSSYLVSHNRHSSGFVDVATSDYTPGNVDTFSLGAVAAAPPPKRDLSLFSTHSSKPIMRPSFEAEAQKLAQIPDDADDDGGVESALLKLEGKYEAKKSVKLSFEPTNAPLVGADQIGVALGDPELMEREKKEHRNLHVGEDGHLTHPHAPGMRTSFLTIPGKAPNTEVGSFLSDGSHESYSSIPLLERGLTDDGRSKATTQEWGVMSVLHGPEDDSPAKTPVEEDVDADTQEDRPQSEHPSYDFIKKTASMEKIQSSETVPEAQSEEQSFLDDDSGDDDDTDLSSEMSAEVVGSDDFSEDDGFPPVRRGNSKKLLVHPLGEPAGPPPKTSPPSPPMTLVQALQMSPETANVPQLHDHQLWSQKPLPPTPDTTPTAAYVHPPGLESPRDPTGTKEALRGAPKLPDPETSRKFSVHLPFILAFDSDILAQQFTLIEKDALNEIDWKELIDMGWKNAANNDSRSWVDFLRNTDAHGVEVVIARFNLMVKWAVSEIVLTQEVEERARCVIKFIHIAMHCRRYRNFATMSQIALALTSVEVSRLTKTWALVPTHDAKTFRELEQLVSPTRNFYNLRAEMEGGGSVSDGAEAGCIPFVGIYTHDLLYNAQRPSEIASSPTTAPLVNFERCRCAAAVVKTLLRLLEASTLYEFQPIEGITERCLWMSALTDEEIRRHSESLE